MCEGERVVDIPFALASSEREIGSSFGGLSWTGVLGSNLPDILTDFVMWDLCAE